MFNSHPYGRFIRDDGFHLLSKFIHKLCARPTYQRSLIVQLPAAADAPIH